MQVKEKKKKVNFLRDIGNKSIKLEVEVDSHNCKWPWP